jgi:hypothetical protein
MFRFMLPHQRERMLAKDAPGAVEKESAPEPEPEPTPATTSATSVRPAPRPAT